MKRSLLLLTLLLAARSVSAQTFDPILNAPVQKAQLSELKGKIVLIDFWATWCGSCIAAMPHLQALQAKYQGKLQVITVTDETVKRTAQYLKARPSNLWFAVDTGRKISALFPHQMIPHDILVGTDGQVIAATEPEYITDAILDSLLNKQEVHLPVKKDLVISYEEVIKRDFAAADTVQNRFVMQDKIPGAPGVSTTWLDNPAFSGRRLTCIDLSLSTLYMLANEHFPYSRTVDSTHLGKKMPAYCLDIIVKNKEDLLPALRKALAARFDIQAKVVPVLKDVQLLTITDTEKFNKLKRNISGKKTYGASHGAISQDSATMNSFAQYLEDYGTGRITLDQTGNSEKFDIQFSYQPEDPQSLKDVLAGMGLGLTKAQKEVPILILYR